MLKIKNFLLSPFLIALMIFLFFQLQLFNFGIDFRDEGLLLSNAVKINNGEIPYRDFPLITTPGSYYLQAFIIKIFGNYLVTDRALYIACIVLILLLSSRVFKLSKFCKYIFLISLGVIFIGERNYAFYNIEGLTLILTSYYLFEKFRLNNRLIYLFLTGLFCALTFVVKQSYGGIFLLSFLLLILFLTKRKLLIKSLLVYLGGALIVFGPFFVFYYINGGFDKMVYYLFLFSRIVKSHRVPFFLTSLLFIPFFYFVFNFVKKCSLKRVIIALGFLLFFFVVYLIISPERILRLQIIYKDFLIYYYLLFLIVPVIIINLYIKRKNSKAETIVVNSILALSLFLASAMSGRDYTTVVMVAPFFIPIFLFFTSSVLKKRHILIQATIIIAVGVFYILPSILNISRTFSKHYGWFGMGKQIYQSSNISELKFIKIPKNEKEDLDNLIFFLKTNTDAESRILCFPYCPMVNFLSKRNSASYFNFFYPETFISADQSRVISDLEERKNTVVLLQRVGVIEQEADYEDVRLKVLRQYILSNFKLIRVTPNFGIYEKVFISFYKPRLNALHQL